MSLKWKVLLGVTITSVVAVVASNLISLNMEVGRIDNSLEKDALTLAKIVGGSSTGALSFSDKVSARQTLATLSASQRVSGAVLYDAVGSPFVWYQRGQTESNRLPSGLPSSARGRSLDHGSEALEIFEPISANGRSAGTIFLRLDLDEKNEAIAGAVMNTTLVVIAVSLLAATVSFVIQSAIVKPINAVVAALKDIAQGEGDLTRRINTHSHDEVGELATWFNTFIEKIQTVISDFSGTASALNDNAEKLSGTAKETEKGIVSQQSEIQQVVAAVREMAAVVEDVADNVSQTANNAEGADAEAKNGYAVVTRTMKQIEELSADIVAAADVIDRLRQETDNIGSVLDVIRGIAEQTNLLALNAAIEAARAGEQGRGFAVVADEVRSLAGKVGGAADQIDEIVGRMTKAVQSATDGTHAVVERTANARDIIEATVQRFNSMVSDFESSHGDLLMVSTAIEEISANNRETLGRSQTIRDLGQRIHKDLDKAFDHADVMSHTTNQAVRDYVRMRIGRGVLEPVIDLIDERKLELEQMLTQLLDRGIDVFDRNYQPIPSTDPPQFTTVWSAPLREILQNKMDAWYQQYQHKGINYCMPIDDGGFVAVNRSELSKPRTGNPEVDRQQSRVSYFAVDKQRAASNKKIDDIALSTFTILNGQIVFSLARPLVVRGRRWGTVNIGIMPSVFGIDENNHHAA